MRNNRLKNSMGFTLFFLWILTVVQVQSQCIFNKSNGVLNCRNKNITSIPKNIPPDAKIVDFSHNNIQKLEKNAFNCCTSVVELYLADNNISHVNYGVFGQLNNLKILDLSDNSLTNFLVETPVSLEVLYLDANPLSSNEYLFQQRLLYLRYLSLVGTGLVKAPVFSTFLPVLEFLDLRENPSLTVNEDDLKKLQHLRILYLSPRIFGGRGKIQKCKEFVKIATALKIEAKFFSCHPEEKFAIASRNFERVYQPNNAMPDRPENVLVWPEPIVNHTDLHDLQTTVSNGMTNFIRSLIVEKTEQADVRYKVKEPMKLEDYEDLGQRTHLFDVSMIGFPSLSVKKNVVNFATVDAEVIKSFQVEYKTNDTNKDITISGNFEIEETTASFICKFTKTNYKTIRDMNRRYDFQVSPDRIRETLSFEKMDCTTTLNNRHVDKVINAVLTAMSQTWIDSASNIANIVTVQPSIGNVSSKFSDMYRSRVLRDIIHKGIDYLRIIDINSFDVTPSVYLREQGAESDGQEIVYNIKIYNLFDYYDYDVKYKMNEESTSSSKILGDAVIRYNDKNTARLAITAKSDTSDVMNIYIKSIEFQLTVDLTLTNKVYKFNIEDINVNVIEKETQQRPASLVSSIVKRYLGIELAREFKRSLTFLTSKVDFYGLNVA